MLRPQPSDQRQKRFFTDSRTFGPDCQIIRGIPYGVATTVAPKSTPDEPTESPALPGRQLRILLAEDNPINQLLVKAMLQKLGHAVVVAKNGIDAVKAVENGEFDAILMDMQMPEMDGDDATRVIRAMPQPRAEMPIIALSADVMVEHRERYLKSGVNDLVAKPIDWQVLSDTLAKHTAHLTGPRS